MTGVVVDPGHDVRAAEALRVLERGVRDLLAGLEIDQPHDDGRGPEIDREAVNRTGRAGDFFAGHRVDHSIAGAHDRGIERRGLVVAGRWSARRSMRIWPRRIVWHSTSPARRVSGTGRQAETGAGRRDGFRSPSAANQLHPAA
jgi:hypothetical protein